MKEKMELEAKQKDENKYNMFKQYLFDRLDDDEEKIQMKDVDLVSFFKSYYSLYPS